ncbi:MAG: bifunctional copper resistance protein CopD/cytochrome c oxidase assembly protein [Actinomycetota bacterium]|nr:bifunctional copper resistance protein CopD/cytochrome c oxidase assembly protein [Actinomycetota bacterium]
MAIPRASVGAAPATVTAPARGAAVAALAVALVACVVAVIVGGAATPVVEGLADVGPVVRWGLPLLTVVHDASAALTVGLLVLGAFLLPGGSTPAALLRASRYAVTSGLVWVVAGLLLVVLGFSDAAGTPLGDGQFWTQFATYVWSLETLRVGLISAALAAGAVTLAAFALRRNGVVAAAILSIGAVLPLALAGHASGGTDHETAVNTLAAHLVGALLWVGGLMAIVVMRPLLGRHLPVVVSRFSTMALWCFVAVAVSGVVSAVVRLGGLSELGNLTTPYGVLVVVKAVCLVLLGLLGMQQRRRVVDRMGDGRTGTSERALFVRFATIETLVMGVAFGFAAALSRSAPPNLDLPVDVSPAVRLTSYPAPAAPGGSTWLTLWRFDWLWGVVAVVAIGAYLAWVVRLRRRGDRWSVMATLSWVFGWVLMVWATCGAPGVLGRVSFSWHMIEHMVIAMYVPTLLVLGAPISLALRAIPARGDGSIGLRELLLGLVHSRPMRVLANPVVAAALFFSSLAIFYFSPLFGLALTTHTGHVLMVAHFLLTGYLFAWVLVGRDPGPPKWSPSLRLLILLVTVSFHAFFGVALMSGTVLLAPDFFATVQIPWIPDVVADQQLGGSIAWAVGELPTLVLAMFVVLDWVRTDTALARRTDRQADRDGDAELVAYNERLKDLATRRGSREV